MWPGPPCWYGLDTAYWVSCKPGLLPRLDGTLQWIQCLCNIRVIGSISNSSDYKLRYIVICKIHFGRVLFVLVLKGNICACYCKNISLWEGVLVPEAVFRLFHFGRVLRFWKAKCVKLLVYHGTLAWDVTCSSSVMYPRLSGYCSFSQCQLYQLQCQFAIHSSLKGNRLPHLSPVLAGSLFAWPCHDSWCTWPAMQLKTDELQLNLLGLPFLLQGSSHEVFQTAMADHLPVVVLSSRSGLLDDSSRNCWPFLWAFSWSGSVSQWSHYFVGSLVVMMCV